MDRFRKQKKNIENTLLEVINLKTSYILKTIISYKKPYIQYKKSDVNTLHYKNENVSHRPHVTNPLKNYNILFSNTKPIIFFFS